LPPYRIPKGIGRRIGHDANGGSLNRMFESYLASVEMNAPIRVGVGESILQVTFDMTTDAGQLSTNLMMTSRVKIDFQKVVTV
jgi:hypothetical protein